MNATIHAELAATTSTVTSGDALVVVDAAFAALGGASLLDTLRSLDDEIYLVGGAVRDGLIGAGEPRDLDLLVPNYSSDPHRILRGLGSSRRNRHGNWRYTLNGNLQIDVIEPRFFYREFSDAVETLAYFDASVNAIGFRIGDGCILDPLGGALDLTAGRVTLPTSRWTSMDSFESVHVTLRVARLLSRVSLEVVNPELALDQLTKFDSVDWSELERLNGISRPEAVDQVLRAFAR